MFYLNFKLSLIQFIFTKAWIPLQKKKMTIKIHVCGWIILLFNSDLNIFTCLQRNDMLDEDLTGIFTNDSTLGPHNGDVHTNCRSYTHTFYYATLRHIHIEVFLKVLYMKGMAFSTATGGLASNGIFQRLLLKARHTPHPDSHFTFKRELRRGVAKEFSSRTMEVKNAKHSFLFMKGIRDNEVDSLECGWYLDPRFRCWLYENSLDKNEFT